MAKKIGSGVAGLAAWVAVVGVVGGVMRRAWPEYASVAEAMTFTLPMMFARLAIGAVATLATGWVTAVIAGGSQSARLTAGAILLVAFVPQHVRLWNVFPVWYHLTFLASLVPLTYWGGAMASTPPRPGPFRSESSAPRSTI